MKKITASILSLAMVLMMLITPVRTFAETKPAVWDGKADISWYAENKTVFDISTASQLAGLSQLVNEGKSMQGKVINLTSDIVMNDTANWKDWYNKPPKNKFTPIGKSGNAASGLAPFKGLFNGNGHTISGLYVNNFGVAGLFGYIEGACVSNVIIKESVIIGYDDGKTKAINKGCFAGAIAGIADGCVINQCENSGLVYAIGPADPFSGERDAYAGGIVGSAHTENVIPAVAAGGFAMFGTFYNAAIFNDGNGGLIKSSGIMNCVNLNTVTARCANSAYCGGIAGWVNNGTMQNCLNLWTPSSKTDNSSKNHNGQLVGGVYICNIINCYYWYDGVNKLRAIGEDLKTSVVEVKREATACTKKEIMAKTFAKKLGTSFIYVEGDRPYLSCDLRKATKPVVSDKPTFNVSNGKAKLSWNSIKGAVSYSVYYQKQSGEYVKLICTRYNRVTIEKLKSGNTYNMYVEANFSDGTSKLIGGNFSFTA